MTEVIKRDGRKTKFNTEKIVIAIEKAMKSPSGIYIENQASEIANEIKNEDKDKEISIYDIRLSLL